MLLGQRFPNFFGQGTFLIFICYGGTPICTKRIEAYIAPETQ